ncbi:MAG: hypothetical protein HOW97_42705 [Catenulispora sp.]|nr:hypothetical protein [Catenulispora sp.]
MNRPLSNDGPSYARPMPNLGFDPTPGDVGLTKALGGRFADVSGSLDDLAAQLGRLDFSGWQGDAGDKAKAVVNGDLVPALKDAATIATQISSGLDNWSGKLAGFQSEADALERRALNAATDLDSTRSQLTSAQGPGKRLLEEAATDAQSAADATADAAQELHERYLQAAESAGAEASGEESSAFKEATENFNKVAGGALTPFQLVAGDAWVDLFAHLGTVMKNVDTEIELVQAMERGPDRLAAFKALAESFEDSAREVDKNHLVSKTIDKTAVPGKMQEFVAKDPDLFRGGAMLTSTLGILADLGATISPEDKGTMGDVDKGVAVVNGTVIAVDVSGGLEAAVAANASLDWVPGVGEGVIVTTGAYLAGDWLYHHWEPAHDAPEHIANMPSNLWNGLKSGFHEFAHLPGM